MVLLQSHRKGLTGFDKRYAPGRSQSVLGTPAVRVIQSIEMITGERHREIRRRKIRYKS